MAAMKARDLNILRGKAMAGATLRPEETLALFGHVDELETLLDDPDNGDMFGTEGWRHLLGIDH